MPLKTLPEIGYNFLEQQFIILNRNEGNILEPAVLKKKKQNKMN